MVQILEYTAAVVLIFSITAVIIGFGALLFNWKKFK